MKKVLVTGAGGPLGVNVTRSLKKASETIFTLGTECNPYHIPLALTDKVEKIPHASDEGPYIKKIVELVKKHEIGLIFPTHPLEVTVLGKNRDKIGCRIFLPSQKVIETGIDKYLSYKIWSEKGVSVPKTVLVGNRKELEAAFAAIDTRPVWVRGSGTPGTGMGGKALACRTVEEAEGWISYWKGWSNFICSEFLPGDNMTWMSIWKNGELITSQGRLRLEYIIPHVSQSGVTGAPAVSKTVHSGELNELGERAVLAIDGKPHGTYFVDFKGDKSGKLKVTEINPGRFGTTIHFYTEAGVNFPFIYAKLAFDESVSVKKYDPLPAGIYWLRTIDCGPMLAKEEDFF